MATIIQELYLYTNRYAVQSYQWSFPINLARGTWFIHCALTRTQIMRPGALQSATCGIITAVMQNPPLFTAHPEGWRAVLYGTEMTQVTFGVDLINCDATACIIAQRWG